MAYLFGTGPGHLSARAARAARREGATLVNYTGPECGCGYRCRPGTCERSRRHWFEAADLGTAFQRDVSARVLVAVRAAATIEDRKVLGDPQCKS
jgi:hypothetical protein